MAFATIKSPNFRPYDQIVPAGLDLVIIDETIIVDPFATVGDYYELRQIPAGCTIVQHELIENGDGDTHATPLLDIDLVLIEDALPGVAGTKTQLYNGGNRFIAASTTRVSGYLNRKVSDNVDGMAVLALEGIAKAATSAAFALKWLIWIKA